MVVSFLGLLVCVLTSNASVSSNQGTRDRKLPFSVQRHINGEAMLSAAMNEQWDVVCDHARYGAFLNARGGPYNQTALMIASSKNSEQAVSCLLDYGADVFVVDDHQWTALFHAAGSSNITALLLAHNTALVFGRDSAGKTALFQAVKLRCLECAQMLVKYGADGNATNADNHTNSLHAAAYDGNFEMVKFLREEASADIVQSELVGSPLALSLINCHESTASYLIDVSEENFSLPIVSYNGVTVGHLAVACNFIDLLEKMLKTKPSFNIDRQSLPNGQTMLMVALLEKKFEAAQWLIEHGADIGLVDVDGKNAVDYALSLENPGRVLLAMWRQTSKRF